MTIRLASACLMFFASSACGGGDNGENGASSLIATTAEPAGDNCPLGGLKLEAGLDLDGSGELDADEVVSTDYVCDAPGNILASTTLPPGLDCVNGGSRVEYGVDVNGNDTLEADEIDDFVLICSGVCQGQLVSYSKSLTALGTSETALLDLTEVQVTGSPGNINLLNANGIGVVGGDFTDSLDSTESMTFTFVELAASKVVYAVNAAGNNNGVGLAGDATLEAFDLYGASLGSVDLAGTGNHPVSAFFNNNPVRSFVVTAAGDAQRISALAFERCE